MGFRKGLKSFVGGLIMTLVLVVLVPMIVDHYIKTYITEVVGETTFLALSSEAIVNILVWVVILAFFILMGAGGVLKRFGIVGILGLLAAYWLLGDITDAFVPVATLAIVLVITKTIRMKREKRNQQS
mgnify:CR=1 FL=1